jgi:hypothetical protein
MEIVNVQGRLRLFRATSACLYPRVAKDYFAFLLACVASLLLITVQPAAPVRGGDPAASSS